MERAEEAAGDEEDQRQGAGGVAAAGVQERARPAAHHDLHAEAEDEGAEDHADADRGVRADQLVRRRREQRHRDRGGQPDRDQLGDETPARRARSRSAATGRRAARRKPRPRG
jgi:hypothetical protein